MAAEKATERRLCRVCNCVLSSYNSDDVCSPCHSAEIVALYQRPPQVRTSNELADVGVEGYAKALGITTEQAISRAIDLNLLPSGFRPNVKKMAKLARMGNKSHSEAADELGVSRFTIATWRQKLGLKTSRRTTSAPKTPRTKGKPA